MWRVWKLRLLARRLLVACACFSSLLLCFLLSHQHASSCACVSACEANAGSGGHHAGSAGHLQVLLQFLCAPGPWQPAILCALEVACGCTRAKCGPSPTRRDWLARKEARTGGGRACCWLGALTLTRAEDIGERAAHVSAGLRLLLPSGAQTRASCPVFQKRSSSQNSPSSCAFACRAACLPVCVCVCVRVLSRHGVGRAGGRNGRNGELSWPGLLRRQCVASVLALLGPLCAGSKMVTLDSGLCKMVARHSGAVAGTR